MKKYVKWTGIVFLSPVILFVLLSILIYLPPVQHFLVSQVTRYATEATGMQIHIGRLSLSFPLDLVVSETKVIDKQDTILAVDKLTAKVQLLPLLRKEVELDGLELKGASVNTTQLIEGMQLQGCLGEFYIESHGVELDPETAIINNVHLKDTHLDLCLADTTEADTTSSAPLYWKIKLVQADMENVSFNLNMPLDTTRMNISIGEALLKNGTVDLHQSAYTVGHLKISQGNAAYHLGNAPAQAGLDPSHIEVSDINLSVDSVYYAGNDIRANIHNFGLKERSGLEILSTQGRLIADKNIDKQRQPFERTSVCRTWKKRPLQTGTRHAGRVHKEISFHTVTDKSRYRRNHRPPDTLRNDSRTGRLCTHDCQRRYYKRHGQSAPESDYPHGYPFH